MSWKLKIHKRVVFHIGVILIIASGALKCLWKFLVALSGKDIRILFYQMRALMPAGFILLLIALPGNHWSISGTAILRQMSTFPNILFYGLGIFGMIAMAWFAKHLDSDDARSNWIEQLTNTAAQLCFLLGVIL